MTQRILNVQPSPPDERDFKLEGVAAATLPARFTLSGLGPVLDQGQTPQCSCYSAVGIRQWHEKRDGHGLVPFDPSALYLKVKVLEASESPFPPGDGAYLRDVLRIMKGSGTPLINGKNGGKIAAYYRIALDVPALKAALAKGPLYVGLNWDAAWFKCPATLMLRPPVGQIVGGHAVYLWGWDDNANGGSWLLRNSWGKPWDRGNGNAYLPYRWFESHGFEAWLATDVIGD